MKKLLMMLQNDFADLAEDVMGQDDADGLS